MTDSPGEGPTPSATPEGPARGLIGPFTLRHILALGGTLAVAAVLLLLLTSPIAGPAPPAAPQPGASFYLIGEGGSGLAIGDRPPPLDADEGPLVDLDGNGIDLASYAGRPVWVVFWATWCPPCQQETPDLQRAYEANLATGLELVAVNVQESAEVAADYARTYGLTYRIALDPTAGAFRRWGVFGMPTHYFIGRDGRIRDRWFGPLSLAEMQRRVDLIEGT
jgi:thiol-disulfide isomerase/thioredoxin